LILAALAAPAALAHVDGRFEAPGALAGVTVEVEGRTAPLYAAPDGSGRFYLEARRGARHAVRVNNRSGERVGVVVAVDGLNAISGELEPAAVGAPGARPGRMYVLDPWDDVTVRGWRASLDEVRRFTFVDEERSYAARSDKSNRKMGWIEVRVYRERRAQVWRSPWGPQVGGRRERDSDPSGADSNAAPAPWREGQSAGGAQSPAEEGSATAGGRREGYPGTGWGARENDPVRVVRFDPEPYPADTVTLRYEYRAALVRLGVLPSWRHDRDRLAERDGARGGFARPPVR
jgi:hypothetical protein